MNERTKQLAEEAEKLKRDEVSYRERLHNRYCTGDMEEEIFREKFAELIVRECALQCVHNEDMDRIEKHFGVEQ